jgi:O-antigen ligase
MAAIFAVTIVVFGVAYSVVNNQRIAERFERTYETGDTTGRDKIFAATVAMIAEKPLFGWRPMVLYHELGIRLGLKSRDVHNLFLHLLAEDGLLGATPFFIGLALCVRAVWAARNDKLGILPLVWLTTTMVNSMAGTPLTAKTLWLVLALSLASEASTVKQYKIKKFIARIILQNSHKRRMTHITETCM